MRDEANPKGRPSFGSIAVGVAMPLAWLVAGTWGVLQRDGAKPWTFVVCGSVVLTAFVIRYRKHLPITVDNEIRAQIGVYFPLVVIRDSFAGISGHERFAWAWAVVSAAVLILWLRWFGTIIFTRRAGQTHDPAQELEKS
jgi:hypothetical protein